MTIHPFVCTLFLAVALGAGEPPVLPPYLQHPTADGMTVCFLAQGAEQVRVRWSTGAAGELAEGSDAQGVAVPGTPWTMWRTRLSGLRPGTAVRYAVHHRRQGQADVAGPFSFRTLDPAAADFRALCVNDVHNREATLAAVMQRVKPDDYAVSFLLGDVWTDPSAKDGAAKVFSTLASCIRLLDASQKPMVLVRGNHEVRGSFARHMAHLFDLPLLRATDGEFDQQWQFALAAGPVWFVGLDGGDDFTKRYEQFQPLRRRQAEWLTGVLERKEGAGAWRVLLVHMPLHNDNIWNSEPCRQMWEPILAGAGIDLALSGHDHGWKSLPKGKTFTITKDKPEADKQDPQARTSWSYTMPWPALIGGGPALQGDEEGTVMLLAADAQALTVRLLGAAGERELPRIHLEAKNPPPAR